MPARVKSKDARAFGPPEGSASVHLNALRGVAAFSVLLNHWRDAFFADYGSLAQHNLAITLGYLVASLGHQWVIVFFVLSGYLVGGSVLRSVSTNRWSWRAYLLARLTRLYIVLLPALVLGGFLDWSGMHIAGAQPVYAGQSGMHALTANVGTTLTLPTFIENGLFLQTIALPWLHGRVAPTFGSNGPLWSLSNEFWYYIAFPFLVLLLGRSRSLGMRIIGSVILICWGWFVGAAIALLGITWLMGVLITFLPPFPGNHRWSRSVAILAALALFAGALVLDKILNSMQGDLILGTAVTFLIWVILHCARSPLPAVYVRTAHRAAHSSYTLYLVHLPMLIFLKATLHLPRANPSWSAFMVAMGLLAAIVLYAQLVYQFFERNTDRVRSWIKPHVLRGQIA